MKLLRKKAQVWIETVVYTLIGLILISTVLAFAIPAIQKQKDKAIIDRTIEAMNQLDNNILEVKRNGVANVKTMDFVIGRGKLTIDGEKEIIKFYIDDSAYAYSEVGFDVKIPGSNMKVLTEKNGKKFKITTTLDYSQKIDLTYSLNNNAKVLTPVPTPYTLSIENNGINPVNPSGLINIDIYQNS